MAKGRGLFAEAKEWVADELRLRADGLVNALTGLGDALKDKRLQAEWKAETVTQGQLEAFYRASAIAASVVETPINDEFRRGFDVRVGEDEDADDTAKSQGEDMVAAMDDRGFTERVKTARFWRRAYGGAAILLGCEDKAASLEDPLDETAIESFKSLTVLSPEECRPVEWDDDLKSERYGEPTIYEVRPIVMDQQKAQARGQRGITRAKPLPEGLKLVGPEVQDGEPIRVHFTRLVRMDGVLVSRRQRREGSSVGWGDSVLLRPRQQITDFEAAWQSTAHTILGFAQATMKMQGLAEILDDEDPSRAILARMAGVNASRSAANVVLVDSEEEFSYQSANVAGLDGLLSSMAIKLAGDVRIPVTKLFGQAPAGLNATGDNDQRNYFAEVAAAQEGELEPALARIIHLLFVSKDGPTGGQEPDQWSINFPALWTPSDTEQSAIRFQQQQTDVGYINAGVLSAEEVCIARFGGSQYSTDTFIDKTTRKDVTPPPSDEPTPQEQLQAKALTAGIKAKGFGKPPTAQAQKADGKRRK